MNRLLLAVLLLTGCGAPTDPVSSTDSAPEAYIVSNARIYTADAAMPEVEAMVIADGRIEAVGTLERVNETYGGLPLLDLGGATVVPGLIDAHAHLTNLAEMQMRADLVGTRSLEEILSRLRAFETTLDDDEWLLGRGWDQNDWSGQEFPTRRDLDRAFPNRPVWLERIDGHAMWANSAAIRAAGEQLIRAAEDPPGGQILRDPSGEPTGVFIDYADRFVDAAVPPTPEARMEEALDHALVLVARHGITGVHDAGSEKDSLDIDRFVRFADQDRLPVRIYAMAEECRHFDRYCNNHLYHPGDHLTVRSVKLYLDGALGSRGAALLEDYSDAPGERGLLRTGVERFQELVTRALACGYQINTHAIGDRGNRILLDAYEAAGIHPEQRHRNEHAQVLAPEDLTRLASLGIIASMQPTHATSDMYWAEDRVGPYRIRGAYAWRSLIESGARMALGSDFPVEQVDPLLGFHAAVTRQDGDSWPEGGWYADQVLTREEALRGFTIDAAYAAFQEDELGSLVPGKWADFVVLSADIMTIPAPQILETEVLATYVGGKPVYRAE